METINQARVGFVVETRLVELEERLKKVVRQALKLGLPPMTYARTGREELRVVRMRETALGVVKEQALFVEIEVHGDLPKLPGGWELLAVVNHEEGLPVVKCVPGRELPAGQRDRGNLCDHCRTARSRNDTFVLQAEDGRVVQIGRNCLADFLGISAYNPAALLALVSFLSDPLKGLGDFEFGDCDNSPRGRLMIDVRSVVIASGACIDEEGWVSRKRAGEEAGYTSAPSHTATADSVSFILWPPRNMDRDDAERMAKYRARMTDALRAEADVAIAWAAAKLGDQSDYVNNLAVCATRGAVGADKLGIVVSLIATYRREQDQLRERERKARMGENSEFQGTIGKREQFTLTLVSKSTHEGVRGPTYRCEFTDANGNLFQWWASNDPTAGEKGWKLNEARTVKATPKRHEEYRGTKRTVVTRVSA